MSGNPSPGPHSPGEEPRDDSREPGNPGSAVPVLVLGAKEPAAGGPGVVESISTNVAEHELALDRRLEAVLLIVTCILPVVVAFLVVFASVDLYFPADGGHAVGDADALLGRGVRDLRHPPLFPLIVAIFTLFGNDISAFQLSFATALVLLPLGMFVLLRRWF